MYALTLEINKHRSINAYLLPLQKGKAGMGLLLTLKKNQKQPPSKSSPSKGEDLKAKAFQRLSPSPSKGEGWDGIAFDFKEKSKATPF